jgi:phosphoglycolate phosphatase-like HAD superfamily hydrolase
LWYNGYRIKEREEHRMDNKTIVFDMDGTIANFYGVANWLEYLQNEDTTPYEVAAPLYDMEYLNALLIILKKQ